MVDTSVRPASRLLLCGAVIAILLMAAPNSGNVAQADASMQRVGAISLEPGEENLTASVIDPAGEYAYFGTQTNRVVKIDLSTFERVSSITLGSPDSDAGGVRAAAMDPHGSYAYFGSWGGSSPRLHKVDLSSFQAVEELDISHVHTMVIDPEGAFIYAGTSWRGIVKVDLDTFQSVAEIELGTDVPRIPTTSVMAPDGDHAYFAIDHALPGQQFYTADSIHKIDLTTFQRVDTFRMESGHQYAFHDSALVHPSGSLAYFSTAAGSFTLDLDSFQQTGPTGLIWQGTAAVIDPSGAYAYVGHHRGSEAPTTVERIDLATFGTESRISMDPGEHIFRTVVMDPAGAYVYFGSNVLTAPRGAIVKVALPDGLPPSSTTCPHDDGTAPFTDRAQIPPVHRTNVDCASGLGLVGGFPDGTYQPAAAIRRDQMASLIARALEAAGVQLPPPPSERFADVAAASPHDEAIHRLAAAGVVQGGPGGLSTDAYGPSLRVQRDQMASFLLRAAQLAAEADLASNAQMFADVDSRNPHFTNVNGAANEGLTQGLADGTYGPSLGVRRDQMGTFVMRLFNRLSLDTT